jgi:hypothetical protein
VGGDAAPTPPNTVDLRYLTRPIHRLQMMECPKLIGVTNITHALFFVYAFDLNGAGERIFDRYSVCRAGVAKNLTA